MTDPSLWDFIGTEPPPWSAAAPAVVQDAPGPTEEARDTAAPPDAPATGWRGFPVAGLVGLPASTAAKLDELGVLYLGEVGSLLGGRGLDGHHGRQALGPLACAALRRLIEAIGD